MSRIRVDPRLPWVVVWMSWLVFLIHTMAVEIRASAALERAQVAESAIPMLARMHDTERTRADSLAALLRGRESVTPVQASRTCATMGRLGC